MSFYQVMGLIATCSFLLPIVSILIFKLALYRSVPALLTYYVLMLGYNFFKIGYFRSAYAGNDYYFIFTHLLNAPLVLFFLTHFNSGNSERKKINALGVSYLVYEMIAVASFGFTLQGSIIAMGPGLLIIVGFSVVYFIRNTKLTITHQSRALGKSLLSTALLFAYLGYSFIYLLLYILNTPHKADAYLVYFFVNIISSILMSAGIFVESRRIRHLAELKTTREELKQLYGEQHEIQTATSAKGAVFNFDNENWN